MRLILTTALLSILAGCGTWQTVAANEPLPEHAFVATRRRVVELDAAKVRGSTVSGQVVMSCESDGAPLDPSLLDPSEGPEWWCWRLRWEISPENGQPISIPASDIVETATYDPRTGWTIAVAVSVPLLVLGSIVGFYFGVLYNP